MNLTVDTSQDDEVYTRASMRTNLSGMPTYLKVSYSSESSEGNAMYDKYFDGLLGSIKETKKSHSKANHYMLLDLC